MLDDGNGRFGELGRKLECGVGIIDIVVGKRLSLNLRGTRNTGPWMSCRVEGRLLVRVFAVTEFLQSPPVETHRLAGLIAGHPVRNRAVIGRGARKDAPGKAPPGGAVNLAIPVKFHQHDLIIARVADDGHEFMVLRRRAEHCRSADVDILDQGSEIVGPGQLFLERVQIDRQKVDSLDALVRHRQPVLFIVATR